MFPTISERHGFGSLCFPSRFRKLPTCFRKLPTAVEIAAVVPFFAFYPSATMYGAGEKNPRFFDFFSYFFQPLENSRSRNPLGKTVCKGKIVFPKDPGSSDFQVVEKNREKIQKISGFFLRLRTSYHLDKMQRTGPQQQSQLQLEVSGKKVGSFRKRAGKHKEPVP